MTFDWRKQAALCTSLLAVTTLVFAASAGEMTFRLTNQAASPVQVEFFSRDRLKSWPEEGRLFILADSAPQKFMIPCNRGEKICYGAWIEGQITRSWGAGFEGKKACDNCCQICDTKAKSPLYQVSFR